MREEYYRIFTDAWRLFRDMMDANDRFSDPWWERWVQLTNEFGWKHQGRFTRDMICAMTSEMERIYHEQKDKKQF